MVAGIFYELVDYSLLHKEITKQKEWRRKQKRLKNERESLCPLPFFQGLCSYPERSTFLTPSYRFTHGWQGYVISCGIYSAEYSMMCDMTGVAPWISQSYWNFSLEEVCQKTTIFVVQNQFHLCRIIDLLAITFLSFLYYKSSLW